MKKRWIAIALIISGAALAGVAYAFWDIPLVHFCRGLGRPVLDATEWITMAGESRWYFMIIVPALLIFWLIAKNKKWTIRMFFLLVCISASGLINLLLKWIAGRNRPVNLFDHGLFGFDFFETGYALNSFPSGHTVTVFFTRGRPDHFVSPLRRLGFSSGRGHCREPCDAHVPLSQRRCCRRGGGGCLHAGGEVLL